MHYQNGEVAKHGDLIIRHDAYSDAAGILTNITTNSDGGTCNGQLLAVATRQAGTEAWFPVIGNQSAWHVTLKECNRVSVQDLFAEKEADPAPAAVVPIAPTVPGTTGSSGIIVLTPSTGAPQATS